MSGDEQTEPHATVSATVAVSAAPPPAPKRYFVRFEGNQSKRWDGKEVELDGGWLESLYSPEELETGSELSLPWPGKGKKVTNWKVVIVDPTEKPIQKKETQVSHAKQDKIPSATKKEESVEV